MKYELLKNRLKWNDRKSETLKQPNTEFGVKKDPMKTFDTIEELYIYIYVTAVIKSVIKE